MFGAPLWAAWIVLATPHFEVVTDSGETRARQAAERLEHAYQLFGGAQGSPLRVRCYLFEKRAEFDSLRTSPVSSAFFQRGPDWDFIVTTLDAGRLDERALLHEYTHLVLHHTTKQLPKWADEGLAEFYSTVRFEKGEAVIGRPVEAHAKTLAASQWMPAEEMAAVTEDSSVFSNAVAGRLFYAQAWAAARAFAPRLPFDFATLSSERWLASSLQEYLSRYRMGAPGGEYRIAIPAVAVTDGPVRPLSGQEAALLRADLAFRVGKRDEAIALLLANERASGSSEIVQRVLAIAAAEQGNHSEALRRFRLAISAPDAGADSYFELASFLETHREVASPASAAELLRKALVANPNHAEAQFLMGRLAEREGKRAEALAYFERAAKILPRQPLYQAAAAAARESMAEVKKREPGVETPSSWEPPKGDSMLIGLLVRVDCSQEGAQLTVRPAGNGSQTRQFVVRSSDRVTITGTGTTGNGKAELSCGDQRPGRQIEVEFAASSGRVARISFR